MRITRNFAVAAVALLMTAVAGAAGKDSPAWEKMKTLVGDWAGDSPEGKVRISYKLVSSGNALMESINAVDGFDMVTMYHPDGSRLVMTHYCGIGNQPRMRSNGLDPDGRKIAFDFVDATNVSVSRSASHGPARRDLRRRRPLHAGMDLAGKRERHDRSLQADAHKSLKRWSSPVFRSTGRLLAV